MKFDMGNTTLSTLSKGTHGSHTDLGSLVKKLITAVEPLEGKFQGQSRTAVDNFKNRADTVAGDLNTSLAAILQGQGDMDAAFQTGDTEGSDNANRNAGKANFDGARFSSQR